MTWQPYGWPDLGANLQQIGLDKTTGQLAVDGVWICSAKDGPDNVRIRRYFARGNLQFDSTVQAAWVPPQLWATVGDVGLCVHIGDGNVAFLPFTSRLARASRTRSRQESQSQSGSRSREKSSIRASRASASQSRSKVKVRSTSRWRSRSRSRSRSKNQIPGCPTADHCYDTCALHYRVDDVVTGDCGDFDCFGDYRFTEIGATCGWTSDEGPCTQPGTRIYCEFDGFQWQWRLIVMGLIGALCLWQKVAYTESCPGGFGGSGGLYTFEAGSCSACEADITVYSAGS